MNARLTFLSASGALLALAATGLVFSTDVALAQESADEVIEEIVVTAPTERRMVGRTAAGARVEIIELRRRVSYANLDLTKHADVTELKARIETVAKESCEKLDEMFPFIEPTGRDEIRRCTKRAINGTEAELQATIAAAANR
jgi:UrcA family protein